jgi:hypothetical protein
MKAVRFDFDSEIDVLVVTDALLGALDFASVIPGDPIQRTLERRLEIADQLHGTERARCCFIESAERIARRLGPGMELNCVVDGIAANVLISRQYVIAYIHGNASCETISDLTALFESLGSGRALVWEK